MPTLDLNPLAQAERTLTPNLTRPDILSSPFRSPKSSAAIVLLSCPVEGSNLRQQRR
jgi:hypothetical protein